MAKRTPKKSPAKKSGGRTGRPPVVLPWDEIGAMAALNASGIQVLNYLEVNHKISITDDTLNNHCKREYGCTFSEYVKKRSEGTKLKLVQKAIKMGLGGNATMLIFCLKNLCGWTDKPSEDFSDAPPIVLNYNLKD